MNRFTFFVVTGASALVALAVILIGEKQPTTKFDVDASKLAAEISGVKPLVPSASNGLTKVHPDSSVPDMWVTTDEAQLTTPKDGHWWQLLSVAGSKFPWGEVCTDTDTVDGGPTSPAKAFEDEKNIGWNPTIVEEYTSRRDIAAPYMKVVKVVDMENGERWGLRFYYSFKDCEETASWNRDEEKYRRVRG